MNEIEIDFDEWTARIQRRRAELGITDEDDKAMMNSGLRRTPEKRAALAAIAERCRKAGVEPLPANY